MRHSTFLEVDLALLAANLEKVRGRCRGSEILAMVKADAYGHGLLAVSRFLSEECQVQRLGCASLGEAMALLNDQPELKAQVIVFSDTEILNPELASFYRSTNCVPVLHRKEDVEVVLKDKDLQRLPIFLKVDTGMNRLGLTLDELQDLAPRLRSRGVQHLLTHFSCSYHPYRPGDKTDRQLSTFSVARDLLQNAGVSVAETSVANSGAIEQGIGVSHNWVRPGLMLYGPPSVEPRIWDGQQVSRLITKALRTFTVKQGTPVGYGIHVTASDAFIVVVPVGYGDGLLTFASGARLVVKGHECRIFARVNMDMAFLLFDPSAAQSFRPEEPFELWGHQGHGITDLAAQMKTHAYQLMCALSPRIPRVYKVK